MITMMARVIGSSANPLASAEVQDLLKVEVQEEPQRNPGRTQQGHQQVSDGEVWRREDAQRDRARGRASE